MNITAMNQRCGGLKHELLQDGSVQVSVPGSGLVIKVKDAGETRCWRRANIPFDPWKHNLLSTKGQLRCARRELRYDQKLLEFGLSPNTVLPRITAAA